MSAPRVGGGGGGGGDDPPSPGRRLREEFIRDHRVLTRGFRDLLVALERQDDAAAAEIADLIDRSAGAHIDFEERDYYPALKVWLGDEQVEQMYHEHQVGLSAIRTLTAHPAHISAERRTRLIDEARIALDHAVACGAALAHLEGLDDARHGELLEALLAARRRGSRWSELEHHAGSES